MANFPELPRTQDCSCPGHKANAYYTAYKDETDDCALRAALLTVGHSCETVLGETFHRHGYTPVLSSQLFEQCFGLLHIGGVKALGEATVDGARSSRASVRWPCCCQSWARLITTRSSRDVAC